MFIYHLYNLITTLAQPLLRRKLCQRAKAEPLYGEHMPERFGDYAHSPSPQAGVQYWWLHAVSLGEVRAAKPLIDAMRQAYPNWRLILTNGTATGRAEGAKYLHDGDIQVWQPWDARTACTRFFQHYQPVCGVIMETEVWPNLLATAKQHTVPMALVNARLSEQSLRKAQRMAFLARPAYQSFDIVLAQTPADAQRLQALGVQSIAITGNMKFDITTDASQAERGKQYKQQLLHSLSGLPNPKSKPHIAMFASSREGEEHMLVDALQAQPTPDVLWLVVPRHPQRFDAVEQLFSNAGYNVLKRSAWDAHPAKDSESTLPNNTILLGDSMGEMPMYYSIADVALLGGSFAPLGGQNLIEAFAYGCPVIAGEHTFNFEAVTESAIESKAAMRTASVQLATKQVFALCKNASTLQEFRQHANNYGTTHKGATKRNVLALQKSGLLPK